MRFSFGKWTVLVLVLALAALGTSTVFAQTGTAQARFVHVDPALPAVDIYTDGQLTVSALEFGQATGYIELSGGEHTVTVTEAGASDPLWAQVVTLVGGTAQSFIASAAETSAFQAFTDDLNPLPLGRARVTAIHAIPDAPPVDVVLADGRPMITSLAYGVPYGTLDIPVGIYELAVVPEGEALDAAILPATGFALSSSTSYVVVAYGTAEQPNALVLSAPTNPEISGGWVRFVHGVPGAPDVDIFVDDVLVAPALSFGDPGTGFMALPSGNYNVAVRLAGGAQDVVSDSLSLGNDVYATVVAAGSLEEVGLQVFNDSVTAIGVDQAVIGVLNALDGEAAVSAQADGGTLFDAAAGTAGGAALELGANSVDLAISAGDVEQSAAVNVPGGAYGGVYYSAIVVPAETGPQVVQLTPVSLAQGIDSAPGDALLAVPVPAVEEPVVEEPTEVVAEPVTPEAVTEPVTEVVTEVAPPPIVEATPTPTPAVVLGPTARILLDPGANLHLRQYPSADALSLGLAPSGSTLLVNGREGAPEPTPGTTPEPEAELEVEPFVDPALELGEGEDLDPATTWLNVVYTTPDGGEIEAWVNALYLVVRDAQNRPQRLADLPLVAGNRPGEARDTAITPPPVLENAATVTIVNVDPGVNVHIRRTNETAGESLALVPVGSEMEFEGVNESREWVFVRYNPTPETFVRGWVSSLYAALSFNGQSVTFDDLQARGMLTIIDDAERGSAGSLTGALRPTADPLRDSVVAEVILDPGANLHLRRNPSPQAESLALLPDGTQLVVSGRVEDESWLQVSYDGQTGWVSSAYVALTRNGQPYELLDVPVIVTATPDAEDAEQTEEGDEE